MDSAVQQRISDLINQHRIVLFMKGTRTFPQCGFSATVVEVLKRLDAEFETVNVLEDAEIRQGIKEFSNWPTIPQLYIQGEFVGGCDIVRDMYTRGDLANLISKSQTPSEA